MGIPHIGRARQPDENRKPQPLGRPWDAEPAFSNERDLRALPLPDNDPFYAPPAGFEAAAPGTILAVRSVQTALFGTIPQQFPAWQLLFRSTDLRGEPIAAVTTVLLPAGGRPDATRPLLSFQCAIDAVSSTYFPSYALRRGARSPGAVPQIEFLFLASALSRGWAVSIPDHEGLRGRWGVPREPGHITLDGIRAALGFESLGLTENTSVGLWGYSGGGLASAWTAEMAPEYAPELNIVGAFLGSPVGDLPSAFLRLNGTLHAGLPTLVIAGLRRAYPELQKIITRHVNAKGLALLAKAEEQGTVAAVIRLARHDLDRYLDIPLADFLALPEMVEVFDDLAVGTRTPTAPLLIAQSVIDQVIHIGDVDGLAERYLDRGAHVTYVRDRLSEHMSLLPLSGPLAINWLSDRFNERELAPPGTRTVSSVVFSGRELKTLLAGIGVIVKMLFRQPVRDGRA